MPLGQVAWPQARLPRIESNVHILQVGEHGLTSEASGTPQVLACTTEARWTATRRVDISPGGAGCRAHRELVRYQPRGSYS